MSTLMQIDVKSCCFFFLSSVAFYSHYLVYTGHVAKMACQLQLQSSTSALDTFSHSAVVH